MALKPVREANWTMVYDRDVYFLDRSTYRKFTVSYFMILRIRGRPNKELGENISKRI
jgi:hypothetical protein